MRRDQILLEPTPDELARWREQAERENVDLRHWIRLVLARASEAGAPLLLQDASEHLRITHCLYCGEELPVGSTRRRRYHDRCKVYAFRARQARRQPVLTARSGDLIFQTEPARPGFIGVFSVGGQWEGGGVAWAGSPILEIDPVPGGVRVRSSTLEGEIRKNAKGHWTLQSAHSIG